MHESKNISDENILCDVCFNGDVEDDNEIVICASCNTSVHQACYGIESVPDDDWFCEKCLFVLSVGPNKPSVACVLCPVAVGAFKRVCNSDAFCHLCCALVHSGPWIVGEEKMLAIDGVSVVKKSSLAQECFSCRSSVGAAVACAWSRCNKRFHVTCAYLNKSTSVFVVDSPDTDEPDLASFAVFCRNHTQLLKDRLGQQLDFENLILLPGQLKKAYKFGAKAALLRLELPALALDTKRSRVCEICGQKGGLLLSCCNCGCVVHTGCYFPVFVGKPWCCDLCHTVKTCMSKRFSAHCAVCGLKGGPMKLAVDCEFVHFLCAATNCDNFFFFLDGRRMFVDYFQAKFREFPQRLCNICSGSALNCVLQRCNFCANSFHAVCVLRNKGIFLPVDLADIDKTTVAVLRRVFPVEFVERVVAEATKRLDARESATFVDAVLAGQKLVLVCGSCREVHLAAHQLAPSLVLENNERFLWRFYKRRVEQLVVNEAATNSLFCDFSSSARLLRKHRSEFSLAKVKSSEPLWDVAADFTRFPTFSDFRNVIDSFPLFFSVSLANKLRTEFFKALTIYKHSCTVPILVKNTYRCRCKLCSFAEYVPQIRFAVERPKTDSNCESALLVFGTTEVKLAAVGSEQEPKVVKLSFKSLDQLVFLVQLHIILSAQRNRSRSTDSLQQKRALKKTFLSWLLRKETLRQAARLLQISKNVSNNKGLAVFPEILNDDTVDCENKPRFKGFAVPDLAPHFRFAVHTNTVNALTFLLVNGLNDFYIKKSIAPHLIPNLSLSSIYKPETAPAEKQAFCMVCFQHVRNDSNLFVLRCVRCRTSGHKLCLGESSNAFELAADAAWVCESCVNNQKAYAGFESLAATARRCSFCYFEGPPLKATVDGEFAHVLCLLAESPATVVLVDAVSMRFAFKRVVSLRTVSVCADCGRDFRKGTGVPCADCGVRFHAYCAYRRGCFFDFALLCEWQLRLYCTPSHMPVSHPLCAFYTSSYTNLRTSFTVYRKKLLAMAFKEFVAASVSTKTATLSISELTVATSKSKHRTSVALKHCVPNFAKRSFGTDFFQRNFLPTELADRLRRDNKILPDNTCSVCFDYVLASEGFTLLRCLHCGVFAHEECYFFCKSPSYRTSRTAKNYTPPGRLGAADYFVCDFCWTLVRSQNTEKLCCAACFQKPGAKLKVDSVFVHAACIFWSPALRPLYLDSNAAEIFFALAQPQLFFSICAVCKRTDGLKTRCVAKNCRATFHVFCALLSGFAVSYINDVARNREVVQAACLQHTKPLEAPLWGVSGTEAAFAQRELLLKSQLLLVDAAMQKEKLRMSLLLNRFLHVGLRVLGAAGNQLALDSVTTFEPKQKVFARDTHSDEEVYYKAVVLKTRSDSANNLEYFVSYCGFKSNSNVWLSAEDLESFDETKAEYTDRICYMVKQ